VAFDPTLLFAAAPSLPVSADLVRQMRERVAGARALLEAEAPPARADRWSRWGGRVAAAMMLPMVGLGLLATGSGSVSEGSTEPIRSSRNTAAPAGPTAIDPLVAEALARLPLIEGSAPVRFQEEGVGYDLVVVDTGPSL
jgi:hypothetical protein